MPQVITPPVPVGKIKTFGPFGEEYEVVRPIRAIEDGDWLVEIKMIKTGEPAEYRLTHILDDPEAR
jgi:hypothetical protein